jgi:hypothetical protein
MMNIPLTFAQISRGFERDRKRSETPQIEASLTQVFDCFTVSADNSLSFLQIRQSTTSPWVLEQMDGCPISQRLRLTALQLYCSTGE